MATPPNSGESAGGGEPPPNDPSQRRQQTSRISHIVRTYLDLSSNSKKRRASPKSHSKAGAQEAHAAGDEMAAEPSAQPSRLLRELGIRVSRYTHEERRDIILRYMQKRSGRQVVNRVATKIPSRQALAERRRRGVGGKFLGKEDPQTAAKPEEKVEEEPELPPEVISNAGGVPIVGMVFESEEKAYEFYVSYAGNVGFSVRKGWWDKTARSSSRSRVYVCSREGFRSRKEAKTQHTEARMGCPARMAIQLTPSSKYRITEFVEDHNHQLAAPFDIEMLKSHRVLNDVQHGNQNASNIPPGYKNYLRSKSNKNVTPGDLKALMDYFRRMKSDNPSFYYAIQVDENDKAANVFWADARSMMDYHYFGDVICFDMIYKINNLRRPLVLFIGMNHHRQMIIFGSAFMYDETVESFKWLLETFSIAMCGKHPKTILTNSTAALKEALDLTWPGTIHRTCVWQIYQIITVKSLAEVFGNYEEFAHDLSHCLFDVEDEREFANTWNVVMEKYSLKENEWLIKLYEDRENWALPYNQQIFSGGIQNILLAEKFGPRLEEHLGRDTDLSLFLNFFECSAEKRRQEEVQAEYQANQEAPRTPIPLLWQAASVYTPIIFDLFRKEYELSIECMAYCCEEFDTLSEYMITVRNSKDQLVRFDSSNGTVACTCKKFENYGLLCCHILKVFELRNVKEIPPQYFLKRWRKDAKLGTTDGFNFDSDTKSSVPGRYAGLCRLFYKIAAKAAENIEAFALMVGQSNELVAEVEKTLQSTLANKSSGNNMKDQLTRMVQNEYPLSGSNEAQGSSGKKLEVARCRNVLEGNKRKKTKKDIVQPDETAAGPRGELNITPGSIQSEPRNASNQFLTDQLMQGHYVLGHNFELGSSQNLRDNLNQFDQASVSTLQQQSFPGNGQLTQGYPGHMHALQFLGTNPQIDHQSDDQGQSSLPVWDFL